MAMSKTAVMNWMKKLPKDAWIAIDDGGLCLVDDDDRENLIEVGGTSEEEEESLVP
jgi:hypothetical protein